MKYIILFAILCLAAPAVAQPAYDPTDPDHVQWCVGWAYDQQINCMGVMCNVSDVAHLPRLMRLCQGLYEELSVCCSGSAPEPERCPEIPSPPL